MASVYLSAQSNAFGSTELVLINGEPSTTGYRLLSVDVSNPTFDKQYSGSRGTLGAVLAGENAQNRLSTFRLQAVGTSADDLQAKLSVLWKLDEDLRRYGGTVTWRPQDGSYRMKITALDSGVALEPLDVSLFVLNDRANVAFGVVSGPYYEGESMDVTDLFTSDTESQYTFDAGSASDVTITGGQLTSVANPTVEKRMIHTDLGYDYGDVQAVLRPTPGTTITSFKAGVILKRTASNTYLEVYIDDNGTNSRLRIDKVVTGSRTNLATTNLAGRVTTGSAFTMQGRIEGNVVFAEYNPSTVISPTQTVNASTSTTLSGGDITAFGAAAVGKVGLSWTPQSNNAIVESFEVNAFVRRNATTPLEIPYSGLIPGDAPALGTFEVSLPSGGTLQPFALIGWRRQTVAQVNPDPLGLRQTDVGVATNTSWASTADANYSGGQGMKWTTSGAGTALLRLNVDASQFTADPYRDSMAVEVWCRCELASTLVNPRLRLAVFQANATLVQYSDEFGTAFKNLVKPSSGTQFRFVRLGTLALPVGIAQQIQIEGAVDSTSSGQFGLDYLVLVPAGARALSPSGKVNDSTYPAFFKVVDTVKTIAPDLAGQVYSGNAFATRGPDSGLGGSLVELPYGGTLGGGLTGTLSLIVKLSTLVPDDPTSNSTNEGLSQAATVRLKDVRPRWRVGRS